jgi:AraC family transcriptional regulator
MGRNLGNLARRLPARAAGTHELTRTHDVAVEDCVCNMRARSPAVGRTYRRTAVAVILRGAFHVRAAEGDALVGPGTLLLKNAGAAHEYRHVDDGGDRSVTFELEDAFVDAAQASFGVTRRADRAFTALSVPASARTASAVALAERALHSGDPAALHDAALAVTSLAFAADWAPSHGLASAPTSTQVRRVARVLRHIDANPADDCSLEMLATISGLSSFHLARVFRAVVGQTPHQYVMGVRLRTAALALASTSTPIMEVALDAGFGDLSHFTTSFRQAFGLPPRRYRAARRPPS